MVKAAVLPHPYLTRAEVEEHLVTLGLSDESADEETYLQRLEAIRRLIAGAIAEWVGMVEDDESWETMDAELIDFAIGYTDEL